MDIIEKVFFVYSLYDFDGSGQISVDALCSIFRATIKGVSKLFPTQNNLKIIKPEQCDAIAISFFHLYNNYYNTENGENKNENGENNENNQYYFDINNSMANPSDFSTYCTNHPIISSWLKYFSSIKQENNTKNVQGMEEAGLKNIPENVPGVLGNVPRNVLGYIYTPGFAQNSVESSVKAQENDFDDFYTPCVRAANVHVEKYVAYEEPAMAVVVEEVKVEEIKVEKKSEKEKSEKKEKVEGEEGEEGEGEGEGEGDEEGEKEEGEEEEKNNEAEEEEEQVAVDEDEGEDEGEEGSAAPGPKIKIKFQKAPYPFDSEDATTKYV